MAGEIEAIDVSKSPVLRELAEEVRTGGKPRVLRDRGTDLALVVPLPRRTVRKEPARASKSAKEAFLSAGGGWNDVDTDRLLKDIYESRQADDDRSVSL